MKNEGKISKLHIGGMVNIYMLYFGESAPSAGFPASRKFGGAASGRMVNIFHEISSLSSSVSF